MSHMEIQTSLMTSYLENVVLDQNVPVVKCEKNKKPGNIDENKKTGAEEIKVETRIKNLENEIKELDFVMELWLRIHN